MKTTASDVLIDAIHDWGVEVVFGLPGDGINGVMEALRKRADKIRFIQVRHEEAAAFMACGYAKYTGKLGVCLATSGPRRSPSNKWSVRCEVGRRAGSGDHGSSIS
jgi:pyruvate dehydrogenase (quinone)